jgi:uncharacterized protein (DUF362 family)
MCIDLNRCLYYSDALGEYFDASEPRRTVLTVIDGIVAGEGEGPLAPHDVPTGAVLASTDPIALDLACVRMMGFDERKLPKIHEPMMAEDMRITRVRTPADVQVVRVSTDSFECLPTTLDCLDAPHTFDAHPGWRGHVERN